MMASLDGHFLMALRPDARRLGAQWPRSMTSLFDGRSMMPSLDGFDGLVLDDHAQ